MTLAIEILPVSKYAVRNAPPTVVPVMRPADQAVRIDTATELLRVSASISYDVDIVDSAAALLKIGKLKIQLHNPDGRWTPFAGNFSASDRDHAVTVRHADRLLWRGFVRRVEERDGLRVDLTVNHDIDRLEDIEIPAREDAEAAGLPPRWQRDPAEEADSPVRPGACRAADIWEWVRDASGLPLPDYRPPAWTAGAPAPAVILPDSATDAREFIAGMLAANRQVLVHDDAGALVLRDYGADVAGGIAHTWDHLPPTVSIRLLDVKDRLHTAIRYKARGPWRGGSATDSTLPTDHRFPDVGPVQTGPEVVYDGGADVTTWPADHRLRFGYRELKQNFEHLFAADAHAAAARVLLDCGYALRRAIVERDLPDSPLRIGQVVDLRVADPGNYALPWGGLWWITGWTVDIAAEKVRVSLNDCAPAVYTALGRAAR